MWAAPRLFGCISAGPLPRPGRPALLARRPWTERALQAQAGLRTWGGGRGRGTGHLPAASRPHAPAPTAPPGAWLPDGFTARGARGSHLGRDPHLLHITFCPVAARPEESPSAERGSPAAVGAAPQHCEGEPCWAACRSEGATKDYFWLSKGSFRA